MKRYHLLTKETLVSPGLIMVEHPEGEWVRWVNVEGLVERNQRRDQQKSKEVRKDKSLLKKA